MGANMCACSEEQKYRFKNFVVSVYPDDVHGGADEEALGKLNSYVDSNPERIPRICRKIHKILKKDLDAGKADRVMVSVKMLCSLIENAASVEGFVPHALAMSILLLWTSEWRFRVGAADILSILCHRLTRDLKGEPARRLVADRKAQLLPPLKEMCGSSITGTNADVVSVQVRYASIVALGHIARALYGSLSENVNDIMFDLVENLIMLMRQRAQKPMDDEQAQKMLHVKGDVGFSIPTNALLPTDMHEQAVKYSQACSFAVGAVASCATTSSVQPLLARLMDFMNERQGWSVPLVPSILFRSLAAAMQERPQSLGFAVCQALCSKGATKEDDADVRLGVLQALRSCTEVLPMTGGRPQLLLEYLKSAITAPVKTEDPRLHDAIVSFAYTLLRSIYKQCNAPQLQSVLAALLQLLISAEGPSKQQLTLRCVAVAAPYVRTIPLVDRGNGALAVFDVISPYLQGADSAQRRWAVRTLRGILAGMPDDGKTSLSLTSSSPNYSHTEDLSMLLSTDEDDIVRAQEWVSAMVRRNNSTQQGSSVITPSCMVDIADVLMAIMAGFGVNGMPFVLTLLWTLQQSSVDVDHHASSSSTSPTTLTSHAATSPLTRAWLHMIVVVLLGCGQTYDLPKLVEYATDILQRRRAVSPVELSSAFEVGLSPSKRLENRYTTSGLTAVEEQQDKPLSSALHDAPVTKLPSFSYVANIIVDAERSDITAVFGATSPEDLKSSIERVCFSGASDLDVSRARADRRASAQPTPPRLRPKDIDSFSLLVEVPLSISDVNVGLVDTANTAPVRVGAMEFSAAVTDTNARIAEVLDKHSVHASTRLLPAGPAVTALPLLPVAAEAEERLMSYVVISSSSLQPNPHGYHGGSSSEAEDLYTDQDDGVHATPGSDNGLVYALKMQREAQEDVNTSTNNGGTSRRYGMPKLPSSAYVELE